MKIILLENIEKVGFKDEIVNVKPGYGRNYLIPKQKAILATESSIKILNEKLIEVGDRVFFDYDQSSFKKEGIETLKRQARFLIANQNITVTVEGHCDARGTREYNLALGERRAYSVKSFLTSLGVEDNRISIISFGIRNKKTNVCPGGRET